MQLTENFHLHEFSCNDGTGVPPMYLDKDALIESAEAYYEKRHTTL